MSLTDVLRRETTVSYADILVAWLLVAAVSAGVWHFEVVLLAGGVGCNDYGVATNGFWTASGCLVWHVYMYLLLAAAHIGYFYLLCR